MYVCIFYIHLYTFFYILFIIQLAQLWNHLKVSGLTELGPRGTPRQMLRASIRRRPRHPSTMILQCLLQCIAKMFHVSSKRKPKCNCRCCLRQTNKHFVQWTCPGFPEHWWLQWLGILEPHLMWPTMQNHGMS